MPHFAFEYYDCGAGADRRPSRATGARSMPIELVPR